jgi:Rv0078B-related antitoxin
VVPPSNSDRIAREVQQALPPRPPCIEVIDPQVAAILRQKTEWERLQIANEMWRSAKRLITEAVRRDQPHLDAAGIDREVARRMSRGVV